MAGELVTGPWEFEYRGLLLGGDTEYAYLESSIKNSPSVRSSDQEKLHDHGMWAGQDFTSGRSFILSFDVESAQGRDGFGETLDRFTSAFAVGGSPDVLVIQHPHVAAGRKVQMTCVPRNVAVPDDVTSYEGHAICSVQMVATDSRFYSTEIFSARDIGLGSASNGLTWPLTWPLEWGAVESSAFTAVNNGTYPASPVFTITGPVVNPRIENLTQGRTMRFIASLAEGDTMVIDARQGARTVRVNGGDRYQPGLEWFDLNAPGDTIRFGAQSGTGLLTAEWRAAWQ